MNAPLALLAFTLGLAIVVAVLRKEPVAAWLLASGGAGLAAALVFAIQPEVATGFLGLPIKVAGTWTIVGRALVLGEANRLVVGFVYLAARIPVLRRTRRQTGAPVLRRGAPDGRARGSLPDGRTVPVRGGLPRGDGSRRGADPLSARTARVSRHPAHGRPVHAGHAGAADRGLASRHARRGPRAGRSRAHGDRPGGARVRTASRRASVSPVASIDCRPEVIRTRWRS